MFSGLDSIWFVWSGVGRVLLQSMKVLVLFAMLPFLATLVTPWYPL